MAEMQEASLSNVEQAAAQCAAKGSQFCDTKVSIYNRELAQALVTSTTAICCPSACRAIDQYQRSLLYLLEAKPKYFPTLYSQIDAKIQERLSDNARCNFQLRSCLVSVNTTMSERRAKVFIAHGKSSAVDEPDSPSPLDLPATPKPAKRETPSKPSDASEASDASTGSKKPPQSSTPSTTSTTTPDLLASDTEFEVDGQDKGSNVEIIILICIGVGLLLAVGAVVLYRKSRYDQPIYE